jgi:MFS family permease
VREGNHTGRLAVATAVAAVGLAAGGTAGPLLAADLAGEQAAGWPITALTAGAAMAAPLLAAVGTRRDRVLALRAGHLVAAVQRPAG